MLPDFLHRFSDQIGPIHKTFTIVIRILICILLYSFTEKPVLDELRGKVVAVYDGNTLEIASVENETYRLVLLGIDCPELTQEFGQAAKQFVEARMLGQEVVAVLQGKDRAKNYIGVLLSKDGTDLRWSLLDEGLAWTAEKDPDPVLESRRRVAEEERRGLWQGEAPVPPWIYRRQQSMAEPKSR